jgi:hypothetical protein
MAFKLIEDIKVNGIAGKIFDKYIYSCNINIGFSESPSTIVLNAVTESESSDQSQLSLDRSFTIQIGPKTYKQMSLFSSEQSYEPGKNITTYTFVDPSFILDKIYIGLLDRQKNGGYSNLYDLTYPVSCEVCGGVEEFYMYNYRESRFLKTAKEISVDSRGGYIILGTEEFTTTVCDLPDIRYNFSDLISALNSSNMQNLIQIKTPVDKNPNYRQSYIGTLREVLSSWCVDFGYTFYFDISDNILKFTDLTSPVSNSTINEIKAILTKNKGSHVEDSNDVAPYISNYTTKKTLENTYDQNHVSIYKKGSRNRSSSNKYYKNTTFFPVTLENVVGTSDSNYGRTLNELHESIAINKYFPNLRFAYNYSKGNYTALGLVKLKPDDMNFSTFHQALKDIAAVNLSDKIFEAMRNYWGDDPVVYDIVTYNPDFESDIIQWESDLGNNFIGKNYYRELAKNNSRDRDTIETKTCFSNFSLDRAVSTEPSTDTIKDGVYPHNNLIKNKNYSKLPAESRVFQRQNAVWDVDEESIQTYIKNNSDLLSRFQPEYIPFDDQMFDLFKFGAIGLYADKNPEIAAKIVSFFASLENSKISLMAYPDIYELSTRVNFSALSTLDENQKESVYGSESTGGGTNDDCTLRCETDPTDAYCPPCDTQNTIRPSTGLSSRTAKSFSFTFLDQTFKLIFPSESNYFGYFLIDKNVKYTVPKFVQIFGDLKENLNQNTMSLNVIQTDISNDIDAFIDKDGNAIIDAPSPIVDNNGNVSFLSISPGSYHNYYHQRLSYSINSTNEIISCRLIGMDFGDLANYLTPSKGLNNFQITSSENGIFTDLEFSTRPMRLPKEESLLKNTFIKANTLNSIKPYTYR